MSSYYLTKTFSRNSMWSTLSADGIIFSSRPIQLMYFCFVLLSLSRSPTSKNASPSFSSRKQTKTCSTFLLSFPQLISRSKHLHLCCCSLGCCYRYKPNDTHTHAQLHMQFLLSKIKLKTHHQHYAVRRRRRRSFEAKTRSPRSFLFFSLSLFLFV